jgi:hypothetical protein
MMDRALDKQLRMESKIDMIEEQLRKKGDVIGFDRKRAKLDEMKKMQRQSQLEKEAKKQSKWVCDMICACI